jgi:FkbM family methyltransferase
MGSVSDMGAGSLAEHLLRETVAPAARYVRRFIADKRYRQFELVFGRYRHFPRFKEVRIFLDGYDILMPDVLSFLYSWKEIFLDQIYACQLPDRPRILDLGANIGLSVLSHKQRHPGSQIVAFEADPQIFAYLKRNLEVNKADTGVTLVNKAAWDKDDLLTFWSEGADGGRIGVGSPGGRPIQIEAVDIAALAEQKFDFIKMDIEGAEGRILPRCGGLLKHAHAVFIEYHSRADSPQCLGQIHQLLSEAGFRVYVTPVYCNLKPFDRVIVTNGFDLQLNLFAVRERA